MNFKVMFPFSPKFCISCISSWLSYVQMDTTTINIVGSGVQRDATTPNNVAFWCLLLVPKPMFIVKIMYCVIVEGK